MSDFWALRPFSLGVRKHKRAMGETGALLSQARSQYERSPLPDYDKASFAADIIKKAYQGEEVQPSRDMLDALLELLSELYFQEGLEAVNPGALQERESSRKAMALREYLRCQMRFLRQYSRNMNALTDHLGLICRYLMISMPFESLIVSGDEAFLKAPYMNLIENVPDFVETLIRGPYDDDLISYNILDGLRGRFESNMMRVSKIDPRLKPLNKYRYITPTEATKLSDEEIVDQYLMGTPLRQFFKTEFPLPVNEEARFEHFHILGGTGHGKTQFMQKWIAKDIELAAAQKRSVVIIDSQGDLISKVARLDCFHPDYGSLADKLVIIDPNDVSYPAAINMFSIDEHRLASYGPTEREKVQNSAIALYEHFFGELLGAELTAKQGVMFKFLARLMIEIPDATLLTLRDLVDDPKPFIKYMDKLEGSVRYFFAKEFLDKSFNQTRKQISKRLWAVLSTPAFERVFSSTRSKIDLFQLMNDGHIILINTAKDLLKQEGTALYGRFFLSMIGQAIMERAVIPEDERTPTFLYIDECQDYFDESIEIMLAQGRKMKIGVTLAHQHMDQLSTQERSSVLANTSMKACGGINAKDAKMLAQEMHTSADFLQSMRKQNGGTEFAFSIKHDLPKALKVNVPFGVLERQPRLHRDALTYILNQNRERYCWSYKPEDTASHITFPGMEERKPAQTLDVTPEPKDTPPMLDAQIDEAPELSGRGSDSHIALQNMIRDLAHQYGWRAELEYSVEDGFVDVWLQNTDHKIACEITVSTPTEYEVRNIDKGLKAGADEVWVISEDKNKLSEIQSMVAGRERVIFLTPDDILTEIEDRTEMEVSEGTTVRGFSVSIRKSITSDADRDVRQDQLSRLMKALQ